MKYTEQFKLTAIERYLKGTEGYKLVAKAYGIAAAVLRRWVLWYRTHGIAGLTRKTGRYSAEFKLSVLQHMWDNALSHTQAAAAFNVRNTQVIGNWERRYRDGGALMLKRSRKPPRTSMQDPTSKPDPSAADDKRSREDLLKEIEHLRMEVAYLKKVDALLQARQNSTVKKKRK
jgi:transposase